MSGGLSGLLGLGSGLLGLGSGLAGLLGLGSGLLGLGSGLLGLRGPLVAGRLHRSLFGDCLRHALRLGGQRRLLCGGCASGGESGRYLLDDQVSVGCRHLELYVEC